MKKFVRKSVLVWLGLVILSCSGLGVIGGSQTETVFPVGKVTTNYLLNPPPGASAIAYWVARLLERHHYLQRSLDVSVSTNWFDRYITDLDYQRIHFLQSDLEALSGYRTNLCRLLLRRGDTTPAYVIFSLFMRRLEQHVSYVTNLLERGQFLFDSEERVLINRKGAPFPKDLSEAQQLWCDRVRAEYLEEKLAGKKHTEIIDTLKRRYARTFRLFREWDSENILEFYLASLARVYDPHSTYMGKSAAENFAISMNLSLSGIGATLMSEDGYCKITELIPGGPAHRSRKLKVGDRIVAVAQSNQPPVDIVDMPLSKAVQLIRGPKGTEVRLIIIPVDAPDMSVRREVNLIRDEVSLKDRAAKGKVLEVLVEGSTNIFKVGLIEVPSFYGKVELGSGVNGGHGRSCSADVAVLIDKLTKQGVSGLILDLRHNGGGSLDEAIKVTGLFIKGGPIVAARDSDGTLIVYQDRDLTVAYAGPLVVLVDKFSASGSEIVAGALQDYERAVLVGDASTHGKGTVQSLIPLKPFLESVSKDVTNDPGALKLTIRKFYRPSGFSTQLKGVVPDIVLPSVNDVAEIGERYLDGALAWDMIRPLDFQKLNLVSPYLEELRQRSAARVANDIEFKFVQEEMELLRKRLADRTVLLNEAQRLKEKEEMEHRNKLREEMRKQQKSIILTNWVVSVEEESELTLDTDEPSPSVGGETNSVSRLSAELEMNQEEAESEKPSGRDIVLEEAIRVMRDWFELLGPSPVVYVSNIVVGVASDTVPQK